MGLDDLKARQKAALESRAALDSAAKDLRAKLKAADLAYVEAEVKARTGLELRISRSELPSVSSSSYSCSIPRAKWFNLTVPGVCDVSVETLACDIRGTADGSWRAHLKETVLNSKLELDVVIPEPCIPVRMRKRNIWWCGPEDDGKLAEALVDAILERNRPSEFTLKDKDKGCGFILLMWLIILALAWALYKLLLWLL